jgi:hypothetical protein
VHEAYVIVNGSDGAVNYWEIRDRLPDFVKTKTLKEWVLLKRTNGTSMKPKIYCVP